MNSTPEQPQRSMIVMLLAIVVALLICLIVDVILWQMKFAWYWYIVVPLLIGLIFAGYTPWGTQWIGLGKYKKISTETTTSKTKKTEEFLPRKTFWDWLQLLIIPLMLAIVVFELNAAQEANSQQLAAQQHQTDVQIATDQQREATLQSYLDRMSDLLLNNKLRESKPGDEVREVARARTLTALRRLDPDPERKAALLRFLYEADLIRIDLTHINIKDRMAELAKADLTTTIIPLITADLSNSALYRVDIHWVILREADLHGADLREGLLYESNLYQANLSGDSLNKANLSGAYLHDTDLRNVNMSGAKLYRANLGVGWNPSHEFRGAADLSGADLSGANLSNAIVTDEQLAKAKSLQGAIMPDGSVHP